MTDITTKITLGGREYPIAPLTLGQMCMVAPAFGRIGITSPEGMRAQVTIIHAAMAGADPSLPVDTVDNLTGVTFEELQVAVDAIGAMIGLGRRKASAPGESAAPAAKTEPDSNI